ncbi:hypothetical protein EI555_000679 [Monodon monoceros]|uniref:Uncharacterized protein n=1 Tax=Monodon monoceros TaxID=40151 RepID=A0A4U1FST3_MONMO|nr:hypothetical protein EI555_000679 [Monodon monoceros]
MKMHPRGFCCLHKINEECEQNRGSYEEFFDNDYNYLRHLKESSGPYFASEFKEGIELVNKTAAILGPQLDLDPDVVAALGDDFDFVIQHLYNNNIGAPDNAKLEGSINVSIDSNRLHEVLNDECKEKAENYSEDEGLPVNDIDESEEEEMVSLVLEEAKENLSNINQSPNKSKYLIEQEYLSMAYQRKDSQQNKLISIDD